MGFNPATQKLDYTADRAELISQGLVVIVEDQTKPTSSARAMGCKLDTGSNPDYNPNSDKWLGVPIKGNPDLDAGMVPNIFPGWAWGGTHKPSLAKIVPR